MVNSIEAELPLTDTQLIEDYLDFMEVICPEFFKLEEIPPRSARHHFLTTKSTTHRFIICLIQEEGKSIAQATIRSNTINKERRHICYFTIHVLPAYQH